MNPRIFRIPLLALALCLLPPLAAAARPFDAEDLVNLRRISDPQLSPDGRQVVFVLRETDRAADKGTTDLWIVPADGSEAPRRLTRDPAPDKQPRWSADGESLYFLSGRGGSTQIWRTDPDGREPRVPVTGLPVDVNAFALSPRGDRVAVSVDVFPDCEDLACTRARLDALKERQDSARVFDQLMVRHWDRWEDDRRGTLLSIGLSEGAAPVFLTRDLGAHVPARPFAGPEAMAFSADGQTLFFSARASRGSEKAWSTNLDIFRVSVDGDGPPENLTPDLPGTEAEPTPSPDGRFLAFSSMARAGFESDRHRLMLMDLDNGEVRELAAGLDRSLGGFVWSGPDLVATAQHLGHRVLVRVDVRSGEGTFLTREGNAAAVTAAGPVMVMARDDLASPADLYRVGPDGLARLTRVNEDLLEDVRFGEFEQFTFSGWGDATVHGFVVKPVGMRDGQRYPLAFLIHGGPQGSFSNRFHYRWNPQTYAGQGYAAVMIDFHGSTGYGQAFTDSITGDWGGKPLEDLRKGLAAALAKYPFIDPDRKCALGASYGGYMINWIAGNWPGEFDCLVNHDGIFDNRMMYYTTEELWFTEWEFGGPHFAGPEAYERHNPVRHVDRWRDPMLVIHGALDYRVPGTQGLATFTALQRRGIPSRLVWFPDENHWVLRPSNSVRWHREVERWLETWTREE